MRWKLRRLSRFVSIGVATNLALIAQFAVFHAAGLSAVASSVVTCFIGIAMAYVGQKCWAFIKSAAGSRHAEFSVYLFHWGGDSRWSAAHSA